MCWWHIYCSSVLRGCSGLWHRSHSMTRSPLVGKPIFYRGKKILTLDQLKSGICLISAWMVNWFWYNTILRHTNFHFSSTPHKREPSKTLRAVGCALGAFIFFSKWCTKGVTFECWHKLLQKFAVSEKDDAGTECSTDAKKISTLGQLKDEICSICNISPTALKIIHRGLHMLTVCQISI